MLQAISDLHDPHTDRATASMVTTLAAARTDGKKHLLLAASGSVATIKIFPIARALSRHAASLSVRIVLTNAARRFLAGQSAEQPIVDGLHAIPGVDAVYEDRDEWREPWTRGAGILHIELRRWADMAVIAPLSANTLGKITNGLCDSLLTSVVRAWDADGSVDGKRKRIVVCPAMNSAMWQHPITARQIRTLEEDWGVGDDGAAGTALAGGAGGWFEVVRPVEKTLACGDTGVGGMRDWQEIVKLIEERMGLDEE